jgi:hypothetical protein
VTYGGPDESQTETKRCSLSAALLGGKQRVELAKDDVEAVCAR